MLHKVMHESRAGQPQPRRWTCRVRDVMSTTVVTADRLTPYKEIARLLSQKQVSGLPVLSAERHVAGVVTEADLLAGEEGRASERMAAAGHGSRRQWPLTAGELMSSPAVTIGPDATIAGAAREMSARNVRRLPVVDEDGHLLGIVSRRDLLSVFLRPDDDVAAEVREILDEVLHADSKVVTVTVTDGIVVLAWSPGADHDLVAIAIRLAWRIDGVVDIIDRHDSCDGGAQSAAIGRASVTPQSS